MTIGSDSRSLLLPTLFLAVSDKRSSYIILAVQCTVRESDVASTTPTISPVYEA